MSSIFANDLESEQLTFAVAYDNRGLQLYCESGPYVIGVDPCSESASPDYFLNFRAFAKSLQNSSTRKVVTIKDLDEREPISINDTLSFALTDDGGEVSGIVVLGRNITENLEDFTENFELEAALVVGKEVITIGDYYEEERSEKLNSLIRDSLK
jgi:hypothetical protein